MIKLTAGKYTIEGTSVAGVGTSLHVPQLGVVLDAGCLHQSFAKEWVVCLSHCHLDHVGALPALVGVRDLHNFPEMVVVTPPGSEVNLRNFIYYATLLGGNSIYVDVQGISNSTYVMSPRLELKAFPSFHRVPSNAYVFSTVKEKLKTKYLGLEGQQIKALKEQGIKITNTVEHLELAYATDTELRVIDTVSELLYADVLILECTFLDDSVSVESARRHGHVHLDEIVANAERFKNKHLVLMHFSARYSPSEIRTLVEKKLPADLLSRTQLFL